MAQSFPDLAMLLAHGFDELIDVRSPAEFAEDHIPGAINLPVLKNDERARVGAIYVQESRFRARKIGAALVFRNAADHIAGPLSERPGSWRPLVYCWRGGQRSGSFCWMLGEIGWRAQSIAGGYQSFRRLVHDLLYNAVLPHRILLLDGNTGTAKTEILSRLAARGFQVIDLEALANHRGSLLGGRQGGQPSQKAFESAIAAQLAAMDPRRAVLIEAESNKIGERIVPPALWARMKAAPRITLMAPLAQRVCYLTPTYAAMLADGPALRDRLAPLARLRGQATVEGWLARQQAGDYSGLIRALLLEHYDPAYARARNMHGAPILNRVHVASLDAPGQERAADAIEALLSSVATREPHW